MRQGVMMLVALALLAGCSTTASAPAEAPTAPAASGTSTTATPPGASVTDGDVAFAQAMLPHQEQAVAASDLLLAKPGLNTELADLATQVKGSARPEIERLRGWLGEQGVAEAAPGPAGLSDAQVEEIRAADTLAAADLYLTAMIAHHEEAIALAEPARSSTDRTSAALAQDVVERSTNEIAFMQELQVGF